MSQILEEPRRSVQDNLVSLAFRGVQGNLNRQCLPTRTANTEPMNRNALQEVPRPDRLVDQAAVVEGAGTVRDPLKPSLKNPRNTNPRNL